jgi:hemoglobin
VVDGTGWYRNCSGGGSVHKGPSTLVASAARRLAAVMTDASNPPESLYDQIGGQDAIDEMVDQFYERVLADPELSPFFASADRTRLIRMQQEFFGAALGGPTGYSGTSLRDAHAGRGIGAADLACFTGHLLDTLQQRGFSGDAADQVVSRIAMAGDDIVGGGGEDG